MLKIFSNRGLGHGLRHKNNGDGEDLENYQLDDGDNDSQHTANYVPAYQKKKGTVLLTRGRVPKDPYRRRHESVEEGRMTPILPPFARPGSLHSHTFC